MTVAAAHDQDPEVVLALPLNRLLVKMVRVPAENRDDPVAFATPILQKASPYPDEPLTVSCEVVQETEKDLVVIAAALPESSADDIGAALDAGKYSVTRIDCLAFGRLRRLWPQLGEAPGGSRRLVLLGGADCISLFVLDDGLPSEVRALSNGCDLRREVMLSLLEAERFAGPRPLAETVVAGAVDCAGLEDLAPVRRLDAPDASVVGVAERAAEAGTLDVLPASWRDVLAESRFSRSNRRFLVGAGLVWSLLVLVVFAVPMVLGFMKSHETSLRGEHRRKYREVSDMQARVDLVRRYSDHSHGALEALRVVSESLPDGVELSKWSYKRGEELRFSGEADDTSAVYDFKDNLMAQTVEGDGGERLFADVNLGGPHATRGGRQRFDISCLGQKKEDE